MSEGSTRSLVHLLDDAIGLIVIIVALVAVLELAFSLAFALEILLFGLFAIGIAWVIWGIHVVHIKTYARAFMIVTGLIAIFIALIELIFISLPPESLVIYPAIAMLLVGTSRIALGFLIEGVPLWVEMLQILAGILTINLAAFVFIFPNIDFPIMLVLFIISFLVNGMVRLIVGRIRETELREKPKEINNA